MSLTAISALIEELSTALKMPEGLARRVHIFSGMRDSLADEIRAVVAQYIPDEIRTDWPDRRLADLLDAAQTHLGKDEPDQAIAIWQQLIRAGGDEGDWGHLDYADYLLRLEDEDGALRELTALMVGRRVAGLPWLLTAELLEDHGRLEEALFWYSAGAGCLSPEELPSPGGPIRSRKLREGRRRLRWKLGIPLDDSDLVVAMGKGELDDKIFGFLDLLARPQLEEGRLQHWDRGDIEEAFQAVDPPIPTRTADAYYHYIELALRDFSGGHPTVVSRRPETLLPVLAIALGVRSRPEIPAVTSRCHDDHAIKWPPGRNQSCWCGSGTKYKRCCGAICSRAVTGG
jgi:tetratricopeptide (TPR) repeat protein